MPIPQPPLGSREWDVVMGQSWEMCLPLGMERYRRWLTLRNYFRQKETVFSKGNCYFQTQEEGRLSGQSPCRYVGGGGRKWTPGSKFRVERAIYKAGILRPIWPFKRLVGNWRGDHASHNFPRYDLPWKVVWIFCDVYELSIPAPFAEKVLPK